VSGPRASVYLERESPSACDMFIQIVEDNIVEDILRGD